MPTKNKEKKTKKQKGKIFLKVLLGIVIAILAIALIVVIMNAISVKSSNNFISTVKPVEYESQLEPQQDTENLCSYFITDEDFKVLQLTDVHIGAGFLSAKKDSMAINAVEAMVRAEKPDLVIVTGDIGYPVPYQAGTLNNKNAATIFANLMENMGVYWCPTFGNHDTEAYSYFDRESISRVYNNKEKYPHCLFQVGPEDVDGYGNYVVKVKKTTGEVTQAFFMIDSHSYTDNDYFGALWKYDCVHKSQIDWYENQVKAMTEENGGVTPKSLMFFHIPIKEMQTAYYEYRDNGNKNTDRVQFVSGNIGETGKVVYASDHNEGLFDTIKALNSTQGIFFGHDHTNSFALIYDGIYMSYSYSVDYLAYFGIAQYGVQRGCNVITVKPDGTFDNHLENYYQDKYQTINQKEKVKMITYKSDKE